MERRPNQLIDSIPREATKELMSIINMKFLPANLMNGDHDDSSDSDPEFSQWFKEVVKKSEDQNKKRDDTTEQATPKEVIQEPEIKKHFCLACNMEFPFESLLAIHMKRHDQHPYKCENCSMIFKWKISLNDHKESCQKKDTKKRAQKRKLKK